MCVLTKFSFGKVKSAVKNSPPNQLDYDFGVIQFIP